MSTAAAAPAPDASDTRWILAYALLDSLAGDLAQRRKQGLWQDHPNEMRGKWHMPISGLPQPNDLLKELHSAVLVHLCELIYADTCGRIAIDLSNIIKLARQ